jgi:hypothetical protein
VKSWTVFGRNSGQSVSMFGSTLTTKQRPDWARVEEWAVTRALGALGRLGVPQEHIGHVQMAPQSMDEEKPDEQQRTAGWCREKQSKV